MTASREKGKTGGEAEVRTTAILIRALRHGDRDAMEALFRRYLPRVRKMVALRMGRKLRSLHALEDVVQQALLRAFRSLRSFRFGSEGSFRSWMARCVENELVDLARHGAATKRGGRHRHIIIGGGDLLSSAIFEVQDCAAASASRARENEETIEDALLSLPPHHREMIVLRFLAGMSHAEIARELGFASEGGSRAALARAMKRLREIMGRGGA